METKIDNLGKVAPTFEGAYDKNLEYNRLCCVFDSTTGTTYISRRPVPAGINIYDSKYWQPLSIGSNRIPLTESFGNDNFRSMTQNFLTKLWDEQYEFNKTVEGAVELAKQTIKAIELLSEDQQEALKLASAIVDCTARMEKIEKKLTAMTVNNATSMCFIIDQRGNGLSDPDGMVSENYIRDIDGSLISISASGSVGDPDTNVLTWIRKNTHAYVSRQTSSGLRLKQLDDTTRKKFADGSSAVDYISNESGEYDVFLKFNTDIYYKSESYTPNEETSPNSDYVLITIAKELPEGEDKTKWQKWSQYKLIGVYKACQINNKFYSLSGKRPITNISYTNSINKAKYRGNNFNICDYDMTRLFAILFYGYYSSLNSQEKCGYGTPSYPSGYSTFYTKYTGITDELGMKDTDQTTGTSIPEPDPEQIKNGIGSDIKSVNFWGLEDCWGGISEWITGVNFMTAFNDNVNTDPQIMTYVADYIETKGKILIIKNNGINKVYTSKTEFLKDYTYYNNKFVAILDNKNNIIRCIDTDYRNPTEGCITKINLNNHVDIIPKMITNGSLQTSINFCDRGGFGVTNYVPRRSYSSDENNGGICMLDFWFGPNTQRIDVGTRIMYEGDENTVYIIDDETEYL